MSTKLVLKNYYKQLEKIESGIIKKLPEEFKSIALGSSGEKFIIYPIIHELTIFIRNLEKDISEI